MADSPQPLKKKVDEILSTLKVGGLSGDRDDSHTRALYEASQAIIQAVDEAMERVIGPDFTNFPPIADAHNDLEASSIAGMKLLNQEHADQRNRKEAILADPATLNNNNNKSGDL